MLSWGKKRGVQEYHIFFQFQGKVEEIQCPPWILFDKIFFGVKLSQLPYISKNKFHWSKIYQNPPLPYCHANNKPTEAGQHKDEQTYLRLIADKRETIKRTTNC